MNQDANSVDRGLPRGSGASRGVFLAFAVVYLAWGSTYLAIRIALETLPPLTMAGVRFLTAGAILYLVARLRGAAAPEPRHWGATAAIGALLLLGGNGSVSWAQQAVPSALAALVAAATPLWMLVFSWKTDRPGPRAIVGLLVGLAGMLLLVLPGWKSGALDLLHLGVLVGGTVSFAAGSIYSRRALLPSDTILSTGMQMLAGGVLLSLAGGLTGERVDLAGVSAKSLLAAAYLVVVGSLAGYTAYAWLLRVRPAAQVSTYAFVNPVVAVLLGWLFGGERMPLHSLAAAGVIVASVATIVTRPK